MARTKNTWLTHYKNESVKAGFDPKQFAGRIAGERLAVAKRAIHSIATPFFSNDADLPCTDTGIEYLETELYNAVEHMISELKAGKRSVSKDAVVVPF
jgi:hypothetical protein